MLYCFFFFLFLNLTKNSRNLTNGAFTDKLGMNEHELDMDVSIFSLLRSRF